VFATDGAEPLVDILDGGLQVTETWVGGEIAVPAPVR
jgi:hypothetical protein